MDAERIVPIPGHSGYFASDQGRILSAWHSRGRGVRVGTGMRPIKLAVAVDGRVQVNLRRRTHRVAVLVLTAFVGVRPPGMQACHFPDRDTTNNALANLRWDTPVGNAHDRVAHGTTNDGERNGSARLSVANVQEVRRRAASGEPHEALAAEFGVSRSAIQQSVTRKTWRSVS